MQKHPFYSFRKNLYRADVIHDISADLKEHNCSQYDYKNTLLNQAYIIYMVASWQGYVENLVEFYFNFVAYDLDNPSIRKVMQNKLEKSKRGFNTPGANGINTIILEVFGLNKISDMFSVDKLGSKKTKKILDDLLTCRHEIAHEARCTSESLTNDRLVFYRSFLLKLAKNLDELLMDNLDGSLNGFIFPGQFANKLLKSDG
ncbi:HEPN domain-containing protein [Vibrio porteresiae]|uniref:HEPN domain-containing protein n=1 Tax=Vibrio porteresiae DSM 19223 TaxID=1123496 RepID=A0ABZ0Q9F0_9VIBR|nr:HEPN domain-containing protein [Vibrio porteresiae]WPC73049.1 HEPN domain-containing protein [Vibrio porteresiae DSM 19223]